MGRVGGVDGGMDGWGWCGGRISGLVGGVGGAGWLEGGREGGGFFVEGLMEGW